MTTKHARTIGFSLPGDPTLRKRADRAIKKMGIDDPSPIIQITAYRSERHHWPDRIRLDELNAYEKTELAFKDGYQGKPKLAFYDFEPGDVDITGRMRYGLWNWITQVRGPTIDDHALMRLALAEQRQYLKDNQLDTQLGIFGFPITPGLRSWDFTEVRQVAEILGMIRDYDWVMLTLYSPSTAVTPDNEHLHRQRISGCYDWLTKMCPGKKIIPALWFDGRHPIEDYARVYLDEIGKHDAMDTIMVWDSVRSQDELNSAMNRIGIAAPYLNQWKQGDRE